MNAPDQNTLDLVRPKIELQTFPIRGADVGMPLHALILLPGSIYKKAQVTISAPLDGTVEEGNEVELWATFGTLPEDSSGGTNLPSSIRARVLLDATTIKDVNAEIKMSISEGHFYYGVVTCIYYIIRRASGNESKSLPLTFIFNLIRPGLKDRVTIPGGHSELKLLLPESITNGVGADFVSAQVQVQYPYCRAYDVISLICNGEVMDIEVPPDAVNSPAPPSHGTETPSTIEFTVDRAFLDKAKRENNKLDFLFTVRDQLLNSADPDAPRSPPQTVDEDLDGVLFPKAILREIEGDTSDEPEIIDLKKLAENDLTVAILTADPRIAVGDEIDGLYTAKRTGFPDVVEPLKGIVERGDFDPKKTCILKVPRSKVLLGSAVTVDYAVNRNGDPVGKSQTARAQVVGTYLELKAPSVLQAPNATLAPIDNLNKLTVVADYVQQPDDLLSIEWKADPDNHPEGSLVTTPRPVSEIGLRVDIPPQLMAYCLGNKARVRYFITRNDEQLASEPLTLNVLDLPQSALIAPRLKEADDDGEGAELQLTNITPEGKMWCPGFPLIAEGQYVWLLFKGTNADGAPYEKYIWAAPFAFVNEQWVKDGFFEAVAPYEDLVGLLDGSNLTMVMFIAYGKSQDLALAKRFMERTYTVSAVEDVAPTIDLIVSTDNGEEVVEGATTVKTAVTLSGTGAKGQKVEVFDNGKSLDTPSVDGAGEWTLSESGLALTLHKFTVARIGSEERSEERTLTVTELVTPTLTSVKDSNDVEVPDGTYTVSTLLTVSGKASKGQEVEIFEGTVPDVAPKGKALADLVTGDWQRTILVDLGPRRLFARSLYHSGEVDSGARRFTVIADLIPTINSLKDSLGEVRNTTADTSLTFEGTASSGQMIQLHNGEHKLGLPISVSSVGTWKSVIDGFSLGSYEVTVNAIYGDFKKSTPPRMFTVLDYVEENFDDLPFGAVTETPVMFISGTGTITQTYSNVPGPPGGRSLTVNDTYYADQRCQLKLKSTFKKVTLIMHTAFKKAGGHIRIYRDNNVIKAIQHHYHNGAITERFELADAGGFDYIEVTWSLKGTVTSSQIDDIRLYK